MTFLLSSSIYSAELRLIGELQGTNYYDHLGRACEGVGDINNDGYADFLVTVGGPGYLYLYYGGPTPFDSAPALTFYNYTSLYHGPVNVGDVNSDGTTDFIGVFDYSDTVKLCLGLNSLDTEDYLVLFADSTPGQDSWSFRYTGSADNTNDGIPEFWVYPWIRSSTDDDTLYGYSTCGQLNETYDNHLLRPTPPPPRLGYNLGVKMCNNCDLNGDSVPDVIWGEYYGGNEDNMGRVCIVWGGESMSESPDLIFYAPGMGAIDDELFGSDLDCMGDISGDGIDDLWVRQGGRNYVYLGGQPFDTIVDYALDYSYTNRVENIGDINNDGWNDVMLSYYHNVYSQIAFLYCGPEMDTIVDAVFRDSDFEAELAALGRYGSVISLGKSHSWVGDVDGDGIEDVLVGAYSEDGDNNKGRLFIVAGWDEPVATDDDKPLSIPNTLILGQNFPNPFNSGTTIEFTLQRSSYTEVRIYNLLGELVAELLNKHLIAGEHSIQWNGKDTNGKLTATGIYFYQIISGDFSETKKMVLLK
ncbi:MAG: VCBS repeat-containing protein [candidate division Zixibacteria bacterium]|nr:VCBS repeat-containing protein [candidate division Zixibacteria bacterium]